MATKLGLLCIAGMLAACSRGDDALRQAAQSSSDQSLNLVSNDKFDDGVVELQKEESFVPSSVTNRKLDILMVVDDSDSMSAYRNTLADNLSNLFTDDDGNDSVLLNSNWRIGIIASASDSLLLQPFITSDNWQQKFAEQVKNPSSGHSSDNNVERVLYNAGRALSGDAGRTWLRNNSIAVVLLITNEIIASVIKIPSLVLKNRLILCKIL